jgi:hypothetical protein
MEVFERPNGQKEERDIQRHRDSEANRVAPDGGTTGCTKHDLSPLHNDNLTLHKEEIVVKFH